jgi:hypothetical protein
MRAVPAAYRSLRPDWWEPVEIDEEEVGAG